MKAFTKKILNLLFVISTIAGLSLSGSLYAQVSFSSSSPSADPSIVVCSGESSLKVEFTMGVNAVNPVTVKVKLADGIQYAQGLNLISVSPAGSVSIAEGDVSNLNEPQFTLSSSDANNVIEIGTVIKFSFSRKASCPAWNNAANVSGFVFKDGVTVIVDGAQASKESNSYTVSYPNLLLNVPTALNNQDPFTMVTRNFTISNGSVNPVDLAWLSIDFGSDIYFEGTGAYKLEIVPTSGSPITVAPVSVNGTKRYYTLTGSHFGDNNLLTNGEIITLRETFLLKSCVPNTSYGLGWGCDINNQCEIKTAISTITMAPGSAKITYLNLEDGGDFVSMCQPYTIIMKYKNEGTGNKMGGVYNMNIIAAGNQHSTLFSLHRFLEFKVGDQVVPNSHATDRALDIRFGDYANFASDPDGPGVGLDDLDGDGFYDDLPVGATVTIKMKVQVMCNAYTNCAQSMVDAFYCKVRYQTACERATWILPNQYVVYDNSFMHIYRSSLTDASYMPFNMQVGNPFNMKFMVKWNNFASSYRNSNTRYILEIDLIPGLNINLSKIKWADVVQTPPSSGNFTISPLEDPGNITQVGNKLVIVSPRDNIGLVEIADVVYNCQSGSNIVAVNYRFKEIIDYINHPTCVCPVANLICNTYKPIVLGCGSSCSGGPQAISIPVVEREDNSLGWTDYTMTVLQDRANISAYDLSKALYMDEIRLTAKAVQYGPATNLGARLILNSDVNKEAGLTPLSADIIIRRGTTNLVSVTEHTISRSILANSNSVQMIDWDFSSLLPPGGLQNGDSIFMVTRYRVTSEKYPLVDIQTGKEWFMYNSASAPGTPVWDNTPLKCITLVPEMYLMGTASVNGVNSHRINACLPVVLGGSTSHYARRFNGGAAKYENEYRPGIKLKNYYVKLPKSYQLNSVAYRNTRESAYVTLAHESVVEIDAGSSLLYKYKIPEDNHRNHFDILVVNSYGANIRVNVTATCASSADPVAYDVFETYMEYVDYYYYAAKQDPVPDEFLKGGIGQYAPEQLGQRRNMEHFNKPSITLTNQTGEVDLSDHDGSWTVRYSNPSSGTAPFLWLALPDVLGLTITRVYQVSTNQTINPIPYSGGNMYQLSDVGLGAGLFVDYKIDFAYTGCTPLSFTAQGGWNCTGYPDSPSQYICEGQTVQLAVNPLVSAMEMEQVSVPPPGTPVSLCSELVYEYRIQATDKANIYNPTFTLISETGLSIVSNVVQVRYPAGTGTWENLPLTGNKVTLIDHTALQAVGYLKGTIEAADNSERQIDIKFSVKTGCNFVSGKYFRVKSEGINLCDLPVKGSGYGVSTPPIKIIGATEPYTTSVSSSSIENVLSAPGDCRVIKMVKVEQVILGGSTSANAFVEIIVPAGFKYVQGTYAPDNDLPGGANAPNAGTEVLSSTVNGEDKITLSLTNGLLTGTSFAYKFNIKEDSDNIPPCGNHFVEITTIEQIGGLSCDGIPCSATYVTTGTNKLNFTLDKSKPTITINSAVCVYSRGKAHLTIEYTVSNTSSIALAAGTNVSLFSDKDNNLIYSPVVDIMLTKQPLESDVTTASPQTQTINLKWVKLSNTQNLVLTILPNEGCFCDINTPMVNLTKIPSNYWIGGTAGKPNEWNEPNNWLDNHVPLAGEEIEFATEINNPTLGSNPRSGPAKADLHLDAILQDGTNGRVIGNLINDSDKDLVITTGNQLTISGKVLDDNPGAGTIVVKSNKDEATGTLLFSNPPENQSVGATVEFYNKGYNCADCGIFRRSWQYFGIPVKEATFPYNDVEGEETVNQWVESFNGNKWRPAPHTPDMELKMFKGYQITNSTQTKPVDVYRFPGILYVKNANVPLTRTDGVNYPGMNLVSNSYTAAIDIGTGLIFPATAQQTVYLFNTGTRDQWRKLDGSTVPGYRAGQYLAVPKLNAGMGDLPDRIPSMHAFMVRMESGNADNMSIKYSKLVKNTTVNDGNNTQIAWRSPRNADRVAPAAPSLPLLVMDVLGEQSADRVWIFAREGSDFGFENGWDGFKLSESGIAQIYAVGNTPDQKFQVSTVPTLDNLLIGFDSDTGGEYTLEFFLSGHSPENIFYLHDLVTGAKQRIINKGFYSFDAKKNVSDIRFRISSQENEPENVAHVQVSVLGKQIVIANQGEQDYRVFISTAEGKMLKQMELKADIEEKVDVMVGGVYIIRIQNDQTNDVRKVVVR